MRNITSVAFNFENLESIQIDAQYLVMFCIDNIRECV